MKLSKNYEPKLYEADIYALWEKSKAFAPKQRGNDAAFSMVFPLPNANGNLHLGHALTNAIYDVTVRYHRMKGEATLYLPGADHAGFETQVVYEKRLAKEGKSRFDFTRDELYAQVWDFVQENKHNFENQFRRLGASCDWEHYTYTLDDKIVNRAYETFKKLWDDKLIYRGERLVNYCTFHGTGFADIEVEHKDKTSPLYYLQYGPFELATTRPETKFGDTAVAVHPDDERYKEWVDKVITVEGLNGPFELRVVADEMVDPEFGTGAVKITPAHDFNDYEVAKRHNLPAVRVINHDGTMNHMAGEFEGMTVLEAREAVVAKLKEKGLLVKVDENYQNRVGGCYKCGTTIEPMLMDQWFINMKPLAQEAIKALEASKITFYPDSKRTQLIKYLENLYDWNLSRQISWGIPIPAFQNVDDQDDWIFDTRVDQEILKIGEKTYRRDPDVFDTWFSSSSWPYATLDFPDSDDFKQFYPTSLLDTGGEILYPWVSRMIMFGLYVTGEIPFKDVYIHGYVMAEDGSKMSKSLGNVIDPLPVIDQYGSDALRMGILVGRSPAVNRGYDSRRVEEARNFANKLWNVARYIEGTLGEHLKTDVKPKPQTAADHWVLHRLNEATKTISDHLDYYRYSEAYETLYHLVWDDVADWYIEASKIAQNDSVLSYTLETILKLAHPFAPFVTETIWQTLHAKEDNLLITSSWPTHVPTTAQKAADFEQIQAIVSEVRHLKTLLGLKKGNLYFTSAPFITKNYEIIARLANLDSVKKVEDGKGIHLTQTTEKAWIDVDFETAQAIGGSLREKQNDISKQITQLKGRLGNENYVAKAPAALVQETRDQLENLQAELTTINSQLYQFDQM